MDPLPLFVTEPNFYELVGISDRYGSRLLRLGVILPDANLNDESRPLFDARGIERHRATIKQYEARQIAARYNVKDLHHV